MKQDKEKPETSIPAEEQKTQVSESAKTKEKAPTTEKQKAQTSEKQKAPASEKQKAQPETPKPAPQASLKEVIAKQAIEEEVSGSASFTLRKILGGDILTAQIIRKQIWLFMLIVFFIIIYISNRYSIQKDLIELDQLQKELQDTKYRALSTSSQITEKSRESNVLDMLKHSKDSTLHIATQPPYIINVPEE